MATKKCLFYLIKGRLPVSVFLMILLSIVCALASNCAKDDFLSHNYSNNLSLKYVDSTHNYNDILDINSNNSEAWFDVGLARYQLKMYNESIHAYNRSLNLNPNNAEAWFGIGLARYQLKRYNESIDAYNRSLNLNPNNAEVWYFRGLARYEQEDYNSSIYDFNKSLNITSEYAETWYFRGMAYYWQEDDNRSIYDFDKSLNIISEDYCAWIYKGINLYNESFPSNSPHNLMPINAEAWYHKGLIHYWQHDYNLSILDFNESINISHDYGMAWHFSGLAHYSLENYDEAIRDFDNSINLKTPLVDQAWYNKGNALFELKKYDESIVAYNKAIEINNNFTDALYNKGNALELENKTEEAISAYNEALRIDNNYKNAWINKAYSLQKINRSAEAYIANAKGKDLDTSRDRGVISILFLIIYLIVSTMGYVFSRKNIISTEVLAFFLNLLGFLAIAWFFSGLYDFNTSIIIFVYLFLVVGIMLSLWVSLGLPLDDVWDRLVRAFAVSRQNICLYHTIINKSCIFAIIAYLIISCVFSFRLINSEHGMLQLLEYSFVLILILNLTTALPYIVNMLLSVRIDHDTRNILLIMQFGYLCLNALLLSTVLWIFGIGRSVLSITSILLGIMILLMFLLILFPYFSGWNREKRWHELLLTLRLEWIDELLDIFEFPNPAQYAAKLQRFSLRIEDSIKHNEIETIGTSNGIDKYVQAKTGDTIYKHAFRREEPYSSYHDFLMEIHENLIECTTQLRAIPDNDELLKFGRSYAEFYRQKRAVILEMIEQEKNAKPLLWIGLSLGLTSITAVVMALINKWLEWTMSHIFPPPGGLAP